MSGSGVRAGGGRGVLVVGMAALAAALVLVLGALVAPGRSSTAAEPAVSSDDGVTITAEGSASGTPDVVELALALEATRPRADAALRASGTSTAAVVRALRAAGVADADLRTSGLGVSPSWGKDGRVTGFTARTQLTATLHQVGRAGAVLDAAAAAGGAALRVDGLSYGVADPDALLAKARQQAFDRARARAEAYAQAAGRSLGPVVSVREDAGSGGDGALPRAAASGAAAGFDSTALQPGSTTVTLDATVRWSFG
ncbi:hypothetical protein EV189_2125 [Motilibacter rhizosphaerae]|uniref:Uncharacterized protein n=1 Tax=Motilibacter rhizosphaerae TaxID=598652 RepID=A0A4Q7NTV8_9ACTN|nr:SIMPL domain-containing protein [Motilibacter rhizosphaerae]RZS90340.1 hypothetical protein EV189_2125 [Motilibacter rhizosphaerae]